MNNLLTKLFLKYQDYPSFFSSNPITSVHDLGSMGETLLNLAVNSQTKKDVILLIENGANVNQQGELNFTPIQNACLHGNIDIIEILLKNGAKTNIKNEFGYDAKHYATEEYHDKKKSKEIMNLLRNYK
ncbi:ankyrin repeat domain-containing protein [Streptococcus australis]|uniref:ankyrin repeat domain-containing protein n=1 Tax=Streptococcus TaxID=1301 RepID=UPI0034A48511